MCGQLFERLDVHSSPIPFSDLNILVWIHNGFLEDVSEPGKASTTSHTAQWIGMLALQGACNSCSGLAYSTVGGY